MKKSARYLLTQTSKNTASTCSLLNTESRLMFCTACFCLLGQKKGSKYAVHMVPAVRGHLFCTKPSVSLFFSHRGAATGRNTVLQPTNRV